MAYNSDKRLLLVVLLKGLADATRRNDRSTAERYRRRLRLAAEQIAADEPVQHALKRGSPSNKKIPPTRAGTLLLFVGQVFRCL
jgi:hypothetical protein